MRDLFSRTTIDEAFRRASGRCECKREGHKHYFRCPNTLNPFGRGEDRAGGWEIHHTNSDEAPDFANCEILCMDCYKEVILQESLGDIKI